MKIAMIGTRGVPARYGGFETAVDEIGARLADDGHDVVVYCRASGPFRYRGMTRIELPAIRRRSLETLSHSLASVLHAIAHRPDVVVLFNAANAVLLPILRLAQVPVVVHVDGLEWKRAKWGPIARRWYRMSESLSARWSDAIVADARGIERYYAEVHAAPTRYIPYGANSVVLDEGRLAKAGLTARGYHLVVARFEPENHVLEMVQGFVRSRAELPLVVVGSAPYGDRYTALVRAAASEDERVRFLGPVYEQDLLDDIYAGARTYIHGHSVGGTNPSLLRAAGADAPVLAYDVEFNREVLGTGGWYFDCPEVLAGLLTDAEQDPCTIERGVVAGAVVRHRYDWSAVAAAYGELCADVVRR